MLLFFCSIYDIYYDVSHEEGKLLFNVAHQIQSLIHHDEYIYMMQWGNLKYSLPFRL
jgi:hypothetical protein